MIEKKTNLDIFKMFFEGNMKFSCEMDLQKSQYALFFETENIKIPFFTTDTLTEKDLINEIIQRFNQLIIIYEIKNRIVDGEYIPVLFRFEEINKEFEKPVNIFTLAELANYLPYDHELAERISVDYNLLLFLKSLHTLRENIPWKGFAIALKTIPPFIEVNLEHIINKFNKENNANIKIERKNAIYILTNSL